MYHLFPLFRAGDCAAVAELYRKTYALLSSETLRGNCMILNCIIYILDYIVHDLWLFDLVYIYIYYHNFNRIYVLINKDYVPPTWIHIVTAKQLLYDATADRLTAQQQLAEVQQHSRNLQAATWMGMMTEAFSPHILMNLSYWNAFFLLFRSIFFRLFFPFSFIVILSL